MGFTHLDESGEARMVDVSSKPDEIRVAIASGLISLSKETMLMIEEKKIAKGNVLTTAKIAGIQAAKRTSELIPLCHNIALSHVGMDFEMGRDGITAVAEVKSIGKTGAEMEALTAVSAALLTIYDMCKAVDKKMMLGEIRLVSKEKLDFTFPPFVREG
ncbi:MAG: cyclic pyranopterin monophosphate synthase MoaC [Candidatus Peribacteraceae bacterium]